MNTQKFYYCRNEYRTSKTYEVLEGMLRREFRHESLLTTQEMKKGKVHAKVEFPIGFKKKTMRMVKKVSYSRQLVNPVIGKYLTCMGTRGGPSWQN